MRISTDAAVYLCPASKDSAQDDTHYDVYFQNSRYKNILTALANKGQCH